VPRSIAALAALVAAALVLSGCPRPKYPECKTDDDCKEHNQVCVEGFCKECRDDSQCKSGFQCKSNQCVPKPVCTKKEDCPAGQKCAPDGSKCVPECSSNADCGAGKKCLANGACGGPNDCSADGDCGDGQVCLDGKCGVKKISCSSDDDCPDNAACVSGVCQVGVARKVKCQVRPVHFDFDKSNIKKDERSVLDEDVQCLKSQKASHVRVEGHADERGTTEYNLALGSRRANSTKKYLQTQLPGVSIDTESFGKEKPVDPGHSEAAWSKNRRAEIQPEK